MFQDGALDAEVLRAKTEISPRDEAAIEAARSAYIEAQERALAEIEEAEKAASMQERRREVERAKRYSDAVDCLLEMIDEDLLQRVAEEGVTKATDVARLASAMKTIDELRRKAYARGDGAFGGEGRKQRVVVRFGPVSMGVEYDEGT